MKNIVFILLFLTIQTAIAQKTEVYAIDSKVIKQVIKEGTSQYLVFIQSRNNPMVTKTYLWSRSVKLRKSNGRDAIEIEQEWFASDTSTYRYVYSLVDRTNFQPIYHRTWMANGGTEAFDFYPDRVVGSDSVGDNAKADFHLETNDHATLNWELDLETLPLLDLGAGKSFAVNFYHPGSRLDAQLWKYTVTGEENVFWGNGAIIPCWKLRIEYSENSNATFYISKNRREVLKMEEEFPNGVRYKIKLPTTVRLYK